MEISKRMHQLATYIPDNKRVVDVGADHAYLLIHLARQGKLLQGIAGELNRGPFENASNQVARYGYNQQIDVRQGNGLTVCQPDEMDVVVIAGMGGALIRDILAQGRFQLTSVQRLVLQPNIASSVVRRWLAANQWRLIAEDIVEELGILYEVLVAEPGIDQGLYRDSLLSESMLLEVGPLLWKQKHSLLPQRLQEEYNKRRAVWNQLTRGKSNEAQQKRTQLEYELQQWERMIQCLSEGKH